jgi:hypothetical protein
MTQAHVKSTEEIPLVNDLKGFLETHVVNDACMLRSAPTRNQLIMLTELEYETALILFYSKWYALKGCKDMMPPVRIPLNSELLLHSHTHGDKEAEKEYAIPSILDFRNAGQHTKNLIVSPLGITQFWAVLDARGKDYIEAAIFAMTPAYDEDDINAYLDFLNLAGAKYVIYAWEDVDEKRLNALLRPEQAQQVPLRSDRQ